MRNIWVVFDGDSHKPLEYYRTKREAVTECAIYNNLLGYKPNCYVVKYVRA